MNSMTVFHVHDRELPEDSSTCHSIAQVPVMRNLLGPNDGLSELLFTVRRKGQTPFSMLNSHPPTLSYRIAFAAQLGTGAVTIG